MDSTIFTYDPPSYVKDWVFEDPNVLPDKTIFDFGDGDVSAISLSGYPSSTDSIELGLKTNVTVWTKQPTRIKLGNQLTGIGSSFISYASCLTSIYVNENISRFGTSVFRNCINLQKIDIAGPVSACGAYCFAVCSNLISVDLPDEITSFGLYTFSDCSSLISIEIPLELSIIQTGTFRNCCSMQYIKMPAAVTNVNPNSFLNCYSLSVMDFRTARQVPTMSNVNALNNTPDTMKIVVPDALYSSWIATTNWATYKSRIISASAFAI